jgi:6-pyruvoyl-tetrahydropterin synthase
MPTIYLDNVTVIDCAMLNYSNEVVGRSFAVSVTVSSADLNGEEQVVADFSSIKAKIKAFTDGPSGPDHKFIVPNKYVRVSPQTTGVHLAMVDIPNGLTYEGALDALYPFDYKDGAGVVLLLEERLASDLGQLFPEFTFQVFLSESFSRHNDCVFYYSHGLAKSTSFGCQNIIHGHTSMVALKVQSFEEFQHVVDGSSVGTWTNNRKQIDDALRKVRSIANRAYFYCAAHWNAAESCIEYTSARGRFKLTLPKKQKLVELAAEPTVENMVAWFTEQLRNILTAEAFSMIQRVYVSEGLWKGAVEYPNG